MRLCYVYGIMCNRGCNCVRYFRDSLDSPCNCQNIHTICIFLLEVWFIGTFYFFLLCKIKLLYSWSTKKAFLEIWQILCTRHNLFVSFSTFVMSFCSFSKFQFRCSFLLFHFTTICQFTHVKHLFQFCGFALFIMRSDLMWIVEYL